MKYLLAAACGLALISCNEATQQQEAANTPPVDSSVNTTSATEKKFELEFVPLTGQSKPEVGQYTFIEKVYEKEGHVYIDADYIQFLMGKAAVTAARKQNDAMPVVENGDTTWIVPNDYYILNENKKLRTLRLKPDYRVITSDNLKDSAISRLEFLKDNESVFILTLDAADSTVSVIKKQYLP